jgi:hypothetical protein
MNYVQMRSAPAFPVSFKWGKELGQYNGMTLRDYFAANAMQGFAACDDGFPSVESVAINAYKWADAMMKAREA